jgi:hypothetical protein
MFREHVARFFASKNTGKGLPVNLLLRLRVSLRPVPRERHNIERFPGMDCLS